MLAIGAGFGLSVSVWLALRHRKQLRGMRAEMEILETQARNARSTRDAVGQVIGSMTQRVLGPVQNISAFGRVLEQSATATEAQRNIANAITDSGRQIEQILGDALGVSLSTTGSLDLEESEVDVRELMGSVARSVRSRCVRNQLKFSLLLGPDLPATMTTDPVKLRYVLQNMINDVVSTTDAGGFVTLSAARWITPGAAPGEVRLSFEACGGDQAPSIEQGSPKSHKLTRALKAKAAAEQANPEPRELTLAERFAEVLGGSIVAVEGNQGGVNTHVEIIAHTDEETLAEVIELDGYVTLEADPVESGFFGGPATEEERLVEMYLMDQKAL
jgi:K+-sensing histidine kinase KdpD